MFRVEGQPVHGQLRLDFHPEGDRMPDEWQDRSISSGAEEGERTFSLLDLWQGRVMYIHSGSEVLQDFFMFSVFSSKTKEMPALARGSRLHRFDISVSPVNDAPVLSLPEGNLFTLVRNSSRQVTDLLSGAQIVCMLLTFLGGQKTLIINATSLADNQRATSAGSRQQPRGVGLQLPGEPQFRGWTP